MTDSIYTYPNNIKFKIETIIIRIWTYENKLSERNPMYHTKQSLNILMRHFFRRRKNSLNRLSVVLRPDLELCIVCVIKACENTDGLRRVRRTDCDMRIICNT